VLSPTASGQLEFAQIQKVTAVRQHKKKKNWSVRVIYTLKWTAKISSYLQTAFAAETYLVEGQWGEEQVKLQMFQVGTQILIVSRIEVQHVVWSQQI
jgi:hypothetical protein